MDFSRIKSDRQVKRGYVQRCDWRYFSRIKSDRQVKLSLPAELMDEDFSRIKSDRQVKLGIGGLQFGKILAGLNQTGK